MSNTNYKTEIKQAEPRVYTRDVVSIIPKGLQYPSVTTIQQILSKPMLYAWYNQKATDKMFEVFNLIDNEMERLSIKAILTDKDPDFFLSGYDLANRSKELGTKVHDLIARYWETKELPAIKESSPEAPPIKAFLSFLKDHKIEHLASELAVASNTYKYAGRLDFLGIIDGEMHIVDTKVANNCYPEMQLQLSAYKQAVFETINVIPPKLSILRLDPLSGKYQFKGYDYDLKSFLAVKEVWHWANPNFDYKIKEEKNEVSISESLTNQEKGN